MTLYDIVMFPEAVHVHVHIVLFLHCRSLVREEGKRGKSQRLWFVGFLKCELKKKQDL